MNIATITGFEIAIKQPIFNKIETKMKNGFAYNSNRSDLIEIEVSLHYKSPTLDLSKGDLVVLKADAGLKPWAKLLYQLGEEEFVLCPIQDILGFRKVDSNG